MKSEKLNEDEIRLAAQWGLLKQLNSYSFCFTGKHSEARHRMAEMVSLLGGVWHASISGSTNYLVIPNDDTNNSAKKRAALAAGTTIITEAELCAMILPTAEELLAMV